MKDLVKLILKQAVTAFIHSILFNKASKVLIMAAIKNLAARTTNTIDDKIVQQVEEALNHKA